MSSRMEEPAGSPQTVDEAREAVERSRQRISSTLDALEDRIVEKKHELKEKADVLRPVREQVVARPFTAVAIGVGVGALLGSLGGSDDDDRERHRSRSGRERGRLIDDDDRDELRQWRRQRRERLQARMSQAQDSSRSRSRDDDDDSSSRFTGLRHQLMGAVTTAITTAVTSKVREIARNNINQLTGNGRSDDRSYR